MLNLFIPITKIDAKQRLVYGTLTEEIPDKSGEIIDYESTKTAYQKWSDEAFERSQGKSKGNLRAMHSKVAAGKFNDITFDDDNKRIQGVAKVVDDAEWAKVESGVYTGFSHGGDYAKRWKDPANPGLTRYTPELAEVSLVDNPCLATATFEYIKADGSTELRKFNSSAQEAQTTMTNDMTKDERPQDKGGVEQVWKAKDGSTHLNKAAALKRNEEIDAQAVAAPTLEAMAKLDEALSKGKKKEEEDDDEEKEDDSEETKKEKAARKAKKKEEADKAKKAQEDDAEKAAKDKAEKDDAEMKAKEEADKAAADAMAKKDYSDKERKKMAEDGHALPDGSFPIANKKDLENAIQAYGRAKDKDKAKAHIIARAKALGATDLLPKDWEDKDKGDKAASGDLKKGMHGVSHLAHLLQSIDCLLQDSTFEEAMEGDDSDMPDKLKAWLKDGADLLREMVAEETAELADDDEPDAVMEMAAAVAGLAKAGARHSKMDMERVQKMHDLAHEMHKCMGDIAEKCEDMHEAAGMVKNTAIDLGAEGQKTKEDEDKADKAVASELAKMTTKHETLVKVLGDLTPKIGDMLKRVESQNELIADQAARLKHLEDQPMPPKGAVRAVSKGASAPSDEDVINLLKGKSKDEISLMLMKSALANPVKHIE